MKAICYITFRFSCDIHIFILVVGFVSSKLKVEIWEIELKARKENLYLENNSRLAEYESRLQEY